MPIMTIHVVEPTRLFQQVAQQIEDRIRHGEWAVGERLPAERELIKRFKISRPVLREALIVLELKGLVEIRVGAGTYVRRTGKEAVRPANASALEAAAPFELLLARRIVESEVARLAALTATPADLVRMKAALDQMESDTEPFMMRHVADRAFHLAIAESTRNPALVFVVAAYWDRYRRVIVDHASAEARRPENRNPAIADHMAIYQCIAERDAAGAAAAMQAHLDRVGWFLSSFRRHTGEATPPERGSPSH
jgi:DNA-binding FadR family transcriptional regulator